MDTEPNQISNGHHGLILTTQVKNHHPMWLKRAVTLPGWQEHVARFWKKPGPPPYWTDSIWAWKLFRASENFEAVVTGSERCALMFASLKNIARWRKVPLILIECLWDLPESGMKRLLKRPWLRLVVRSAHKIVVHTRRHRRTVLVRRLGVLFYND